MQADIDNKIILALRNALGEGIHPLHEPYFDDSEQSFLRECMLSKFVSSVGPFVERFESELAETVGAKYVVAVVNGTSALQVALRVAGVKAGDEVLMPSLTFVATANAVNYLGATPHFSDSNRHTLGLDPKSLKNRLKDISEKSANGLRNRRTGRRMSAIIPMHTFGHPCDLESLVSIAHDYDLVVIEDASQALGSFYFGKHVGTFGKLGVISFNGNKIITSGGGGAIVTSDPELANYSKYLTTTAKSDHKWEFVHNEVGYNFRLPNINAALGCAQLRKLPEFLEAKRRLFQLYKEAFNSITGFELMTEPKGCQSNYWLQTIILEPKFSSQRDKILQTSNASGFGTRPAWQLMHQLPMYNSCPRGPLSVAESLAKRIINLPSGSALDKRG